MQRACMTAKRLCKARASARDPLARARVLSFLVLLVATALAVTSSCLAGSTTPPEEMPPDIPAFVKEQIEALYSSDWQERQITLSMLRHLGGQAKSRGSSAA